VCASRLFLSRPASRLFPEPCPSTCRACSQISLLFSISRLQRSRQKRAPVLIFFLILRCNVFFLSCPYSPKTVNFVTPVLGVQSNQRHMVWHHTETYNRLYSRILLQPHISIEISNRRMGGVRQLFSICVSIPPP